MTDSERITRLEVQNEERWAAHDANAESREIRLVKKMDEIRNDIKELFDRIENQPCAVHKEKFDFINRIFTCVWGVIMIVIAAVVGVWIKK